MGTMAGPGFSINGLPPRALCYKQDVSSIGPVFKVGHKHSLSSRGSHLGKYWNLSYAKPKCGVLSVTPRATANKDYVREMDITGGLQVPIQLSSTAWDMGCTAMVMAGAYTLVSTFDVLTKSNILDQKLSRKLVHISSGLLFMMSWPLFSASTNSRYLAAFVPLANLVRLLIYGLALAKNEGLVKAVSRDGNPKELLRGPLYYVIVLMFCTVVFWRESPIGVVALAMMCGGDGIADIVGRRFGRIKLPYNRDKSWAGSISMFLFGLLISLGVLYYFSAFGFIQVDRVTMLQGVAMISMAATIVESLPATKLLDDNISVPLTSMLVGLCLFPAQLSNA